MLNFERFTKVRFYVLIPGIVKLCVSPRHSRGSTSIN
jgi:hypothetical protein